MIRVLFLIHDLQGGGAEKVLVNLVNNMDYSVFDITVMSLFDVGINKRLLNKNVHYKYVYKKMFRGNSQVMKVLSPEQLHNKYIKDLYDIEIAYLEGPCTRIISGCQNANTKLVAWIHCTMKSQKQFAKSYRNYNEAVSCYNKYEKLVFVSKDTQRSFFRCCTVMTDACVLYNTNDTRQIIEQSKEKATGLEKNNRFKIVGSGKLEKNKGFDRLIRIQKKLLNKGYSIETYILGEGTEKERLRQLIIELNLESSVKLLGYQSNPHKYVSKCDLFVCSSFSEGFSTSASEALIVGTPVCTVNVSGMIEMLGENNEYGIITDNTEEALYDAIVRLLDNPEMFEHYKNQAEIRGSYFSTKRTVRAVEEELLSLWGKNNET